MNRYLSIVILILLSGCVSLNEKHNRLISDPSYGLILLKADNQKAVLSAIIEIEDIYSGEKFEIKEAIYKGNRGKPVVFKLMPGSYRLSKYKLYNNVNPSLKHINYFFIVESQKVNYIGDWSFKETWKNGNMSVDFSISYNRDTVKKAQEFFSMILSKWQLKQQES